MLAVGVSNSRWTSLETSSTALMFASVTAWVLSISSIE